MSLITEAKREAVAQGLALWVQNVTGSRPNVVRVENGRKIVLNSSQASLMSNSIYDSLTAESKPDDLNVSFPWGSVVTKPLAKKYWMYLAGGAVTLIGVGFILGSSGGKKKRIRR